MEKEAAGIRFQTRDDEPRMENLMHHVNEQTLMKEHRKQNKKKATGIDGVTKGEYDANVDANLKDLVERMKRFSYRPIPVRRTYIPKANGKQRPLGIPSYEDKLVQGVMARLLDEVYEVRFLDCSYGFQKGKNCHDVVRYVPMGGVIIAFKDYRIKKGVWGSPWVGLQHFENFFNTPNFPMLLRNTLILSVYSLLASFPFPILLALAINECRSRRYRKFVQMTTYAPYFISTVVLVGI